MVEQNKSRFLRFAALNVLQSFYDDLGAGTMLHRFNPDSLADVLPVAQDDIRFVIRETRVATVGIDESTNSAVIYIEDPTKLISTKLRRKFRELDIHLSSDRYQLDGIEEQLRQAREGVIRPPRARRARIRRHVGVKLA